MIPAGFMLKTVSQCPDWLNVPNVVDVCSVSSCISDYFANYIVFWAHNEWWFFDSPEIIMNLARENHIDVSNMTMFYYEVYEDSYSEKNCRWFSIEPHSEFKTDVQEPAVKEFLGFDVVSFSMGNSPECSPLSCNSLAEELSVNEHCLFSAFEQAEAAVVDGKFNNSEPGPFRIFAVYRTT